MGFFAPLVWPVIQQGGRIVVTKATQQLAKNALPKLSGHLNRKKLFGQFMDVSEKVISSKPVQQTIKTLDDKVNPILKKVVNPNVKPPNPMETGTYGTLGRFLRGRSVKYASEKVRIIKEQLEQGTITENEANKFLKNLNSFATPEAQKYIDKHYGTKSDSVVPRASDPRGTNFWDKEYGKTHNANGTKK